MTDTSLDALNCDHSAGGQVCFAAGEGGMTRAVVENAHACAELYLHGAHVTAFRPRGGDDLLWLSPLAVYRAGKAIRGGIPLCWPWFGPHPTDASKPQHGFARTAAWEVASATALADGATEVRLRLAGSNDTRAMWPHAFELEVRVTVGIALEVSLEARNNGDEAFVAGGAIHTYLAVADVERAAVDGFHDRVYLDQLDGHAKRTQDGPVTFNGEVDRIYLDTPRECVVSDLAARRRIRVESGGSATTVIWNPWSDKAAAMADFPDDGYRGMICVEAANAGPDTRRVEPGTSHTLTQRIEPEAE